MAMKRVSDVQAVRAALFSQLEPQGIAALGLLQEWTMQPAAACQLAIQSALGSGLLGYGISIKKPWPTLEGMALLDKNPLTLPQAQQRLRRVLRRHGIDVNDADEAAHLRRELRELWRRCSAPAGYDAGPLRKMLRTIIASARAAGDLRHAELRQVLMDVVLQFDDLPF